MWQQTDPIAERLSPVYGLMVVFAAATGLRPSELFALEQRDIDRDLGVVYVRRAYANGRLKHTKTRLSNRAVPLQAIVREALDLLPRSENQILFPNSRGGRIDFRVFGRRHWKPAQTAAAIEPLRGLYDLRHTYATFALRRRLRVRGFRCMGTSIAMIDYHYGHLARDSRSTPSRSSTHSRSKEPWTLGGRRNGGQRDSSAPAIPAGAGSDPGESWTLGGRRGPNRHPFDQQKDLISRNSRSPLTDSNR